MNTLTEFNKDKEVFFDDLDARLVKRYDLFLKRKGLAQNTVHNYHKTIKAFINKLEVSHRPSKCYDVEKTKRMYCCC